MLAPGPYSCTHTHTHTVRTHSHTHSQMREQAHTHMRVRARRMVRVLVGTAVVEAVSAAMQEQAPQAPHTSQQQQRPHRAGGAMQGGPCHGGRQQQEEAQQGGGQQVQGWADEQTPRASQAPAAGWEGRLVQLALSGERSATCVPAPAVGLCFAGAGYPGCPSPLGLQ